MFQVPFVPDVTGMIAGRLNAPEVDGVENAPPEADDGDVILDVSGDRPILRRLTAGKWIKIATRPGIVGGIE